MSRRNAPRQFGQALTRRPDHLPRPFQKSLEASVPAETSLAPPNRRGDRRTRNSFRWFAPKSFERPRSTSEFPRQPVARDTADTKTRRPHPLGNPESRGHIFENARRPFAKAATDIGSHRSGPDWQPHSPGPLGGSSDRPEADSALFKSLVTRSTPGRSVRHRRVLRGNPQSFEGDSAYVVPGGWIKLPLAKIRWVENFSLLRGPGPLPHPPSPWEKFNRLSMTNYVQIVSVPTADTGSTLLLHFDHRRYLFGRLSEGTQRALMYRKHSLAKMETMFVSGQTKWENVGGMLGLMLSVADVVDGSRKEINHQNEARKATGRAELAMKGPGRIEIHGARNLTYTIATARSFVFRTGLPIRPLEVNEDPRLANPDAIKPDFEDDSIHVWKVPILAEAPSSGFGTSRKRSHEVMTAEDESIQADRPAAVSPEQKKIDNEAVHAVVEHMFNSDWTADALCETKLHQVELPATIFVRNNGQIERYRGPLPGAEGVEVPDIDVLVRYPWPATKVRLLPPPASPSDMSVCYIVKNKGRRGKFNPAAAKQYGVESIKFKLLTAGQSVMGKDGVEVTPDMVMGAPLKPCGFAVLDIPSISCVDSFLSRSEWQNSALMENVPAFYWLLGPSVIDDPRIQGFMKERPDVNHIVMAPDASPNMLAFESHALMVAKLRRIDPGRFALLDFNNSVRDLSAVGANVKVGRVGHKAVLSPSFGLKEDELVPFPTFKEAENLDEGILALADKAKAIIKDPKFLAQVERAERDIPNRDTEIIPLGTGSALPSKYRNVSSTLIRIPQYGNYLLDCGENTIGQLRRAFPAEEAHKILQDLRCILISHMHADHHLGVATMLRAWADATANFSPQPKLGLICPTAMKLFLSEHRHVEGIPWDRLVFHKPVWGKDSGEMPANDPTKLSSCFLVPVNHCQFAYAGVLTWPSGLKIAYSGDCRPSDNFVRVGKGATLLIHESTFDDDKMGDARAKKHCTMGEALDVADRMGARRVLLTHFSQRYAKAPILETRKTRSGDDQAVLLALDQMRVKLGEFRQAQAFLPAIRRFFDLDSE